MEENPMDWEPNPAALPPSIAPTTYHTAQTTPSTVPTTPARPSLDRKDASLIYIALDTNVLISHLSLVRSLQTRMVKAGMGQLLIPLQVIHELDGLKDSDKPVPNSQQTVGGRAREATAWLLEQQRAMRWGRTVRVHCEGRDMRVLAATFTNDQDDGRPDEPVLSCCLLFAREANVTLWTDDTNLALLAEASGIPSIGGKGITLPRLLGAAGIPLHADEVMEVDAELVEEFSLESALAVPTDQLRPFATSKDPFDKIDGSLAAAIAAIPSDRVPPHLRHSITALLNPVCAFVASALCKVIPEHDEAFDVARTLANTLTNLDSVLPEQWKRPLARGAGSARTIAKFLGPAPQKWERRVRSGEAADALQVLGVELAAMGVPIERGEWERVVAAIRELP